MLSPPVELLSHRPVGDLLDAGGGTGALATHVALTLGCDSATVLDVSSEMLDRVPQGIQRLHTSIEQADIDSPCFDTILMRQVLHYVDSPVAVLAKLRQALRDGGRMYIGQIVAPDERAAHWLQTLATELSPARKRMLTVDDITEYLAEVGMVAVDTRKHHFPECMSAWSSRGRNALDADRFVELARSSLAPSVEASLGVVDSGQDLHYRVVWWHGLLQPVWEPG